MNTTGRNLFIALRVAAAACAVALAGCMPTMYIDPVLPKAGPGDVTRTTTPQPVQFLYEFQTRGAPNARATEMTKERAQGVLGASGLFSVIAAEPQANGQRLTVVINNVPITTDAAAKGFGVGLTFGLVGATVTDGYEISASFAAPGRDPLALQYRHAIHSTLGNTTPPPGLIPEPTPRDAVDKLIDQLMWSILRDVSKSGRL